MKLPTALLPTVLALGAMSGIVACNAQPVYPSDYSCDDKGQLAVWRARIFENFSAGARIANDHDTRNPTVALRQMRDLHVQLRHYFQSEPMPACMRAAIRIYVDGTEALQAKDSDMLAAMRHLNATIDRFSQAVEAAQPHPL